MPPRVLRDFIYLDVERLKSIIAQLEGGVINAQQDSRRECDETSTSLDGGLLGIIRGVVGGNYLLENQETTTKTLHDDIYNKVEQVLINTDCLVQIPEDYPVDTDGSSVRDALSDNWFVLINGKVNINDYNRMRNLIANFNDLATYIARSSVSAVAAEVPKKQKEQLIKNAIKEYVQDDDTIKGLTSFFDIFYKDRIVVKILPYEHNTEIRFTGNINSDYLREDIASIIYKYGTAPVANWQIFAQIASIPPADRSNISPAIHENTIEAGLHTVFNAFREIEVLAQSVVYPEIAITPIAIYREVVLQNNE